MINPVKPKQLSKSTPVKIYLSGCDGAKNGSTYFPWSYRMGRPNDIPMSYVNDSDTFILDSGIMQEDITNKDVIDTARKIKPDYIVAADKIHDPKATTERVYEFVDMVEESPVESDIIIPLQPTEKGGTNHYEHYEKLRGLGDYYAIGGVMGQSYKVKHESAKNLKEVVGDNIKLHGFAFDLSYFATMDVIENPIVDSIDSSRPINMGREGKCWTWRDGVRFIQYPKPEGNFSLLQVAMHSGLTLVTTARVMINEMGIDEIEMPNTIVNGNSHSPERIELPNGYVKVSGKAHAYAKRKFPDLPLSISIAILLKSEGEFDGYR